MKSWIPTHANPNRRRSKPVNLMVAAIATALATIADTGHAQNTSDLWGFAGEKWSNTSRLPDFSHSGYHEGEAPPPSVPQSANVRDFGAIGDGNADDTQAFQAAIDATPTGAIFIPPGRYKITDFVNIQKSNIVLRGAGPGLTTLWFPRSLTDVFPRPGTNSSGTPTSNYSFGYGFITIKGSFQQVTLATVTAAAARGDTWLTISSTASVRVGDRVEIYQTDTSSKTLINTIYCGDPSSITSLSGVTTELVARILEIDGNRIRLDRPLRTEVKTEWSPKVRSFSPTVTESGIEALRLEFPDLPYPGHFNEKGYNGIELDTVSDCWVRNVEIRNSDLGINVLGSRFCTVADTFFTSYSGRGALSGHHCIQTKRADDNLIDRFDLQTTFIHDLSVERATGNVYTDGQGKDLCFDHHKAANFANLFCDIHAGQGSRLWTSGGGANLGRQSGGWESFWNIRSVSPLHAPPAGWGPWSMNFIGLNTTDTSTQNPNGTWFEAIPPATLVPANLHNSQLARRLAANLPDKSAILLQLRRVNDCWIGNNQDFGTNNWDRSVYYPGNNSLYRAFPDPIYNRYSTGWAQKHSWLPFNNPTTRFADDQACGLAYLQLYHIDPQPARIAPITTNIRAMVTSLKRDDWWWVDALYMAMPVFAQLGQETGDPAYAQAMYELYSDTKVRRRLYNTADSLWYRDETFLPPYKEPNGQPCYWSRGNGWVFAAHARVLDTIPATDPHRAEYLQTFQAMAAALKGVQRSDGFWNSSLRDPGNYGGPETSGTCFFTYGLAWGINHGLLDPATYGPVVIKAWNGINAIAVHPDGTLGYCQPIGFKPGSATYTDTKDYAVGAYLMAGAEVLNMAGGALPDVPANLAEGKTVSYSAQQSGNEAAKALDGHLTTRWSAQNYPQSIQVDLGASTTIDSIEIHPYLNRSYQFIVEARNNASDPFTTIIDQRGNTRKGRFVAAIQPLSTRYVRLTVTGSSDYTGGWVSINEFRLLHHTDTLALSVPTVSLPKTAAKATATLTANVAWSISSPLPAWLTAAPSSGIGDATLVLNATPNTSSSRSTTISIQGGGITRTLAVTQSTALGSEPTVSAIPTQTILAGTSSAPIAFTIGDAETPSASLSVSATTDAPTLLPRAQIVLGGSDTDRTITITPATGLTGRGKVNIQVQDTDGNKATTQFDIIVHDAGPGPITDTNSDGISDFWTALYPNIGGPGDDPDSDGLDNLQEAKAGTDPNNPASRFTATANTDATGNVRVRWFGVAGKHYRIESSTDLKTWTPLPGEWSGADTELAIVVGSDTGAQSRTFWHVVVFDVASGSSGLNDWEVLHLSLPR
jgi:rhamnogalacturonyl hydrolase YesR